MSSSERRVSPIRHEESDGQAGPALLFPLTRPSYTIAAGISMSTDSPLNGRKVYLPRTFRAFQNRDYRLLWPANLLLYTARWMQMTTLGWLVLVLTDSPFRVALVGFFAWSPMFFLGMVGGFLADSADRKRVLAIAQGVSLVSAVAMALLLISESERFWHAYLVISVVGVAWALDMPSRRSAIPDLLGRAGVTNGVALDSVGMSASMLLGPILAGTLITLVDPAGTYVAIALLYAVSLVLLMPLRLTPGMRSRGGASVFEDLALGLRYIAGNATLRATLLITVLMNLLLFPYKHLVPVMARDVLHVGPGLMGVLQAASGLGALIGAVVIASALDIRYRGRLFIGGSMFALTALLLFSLSRSYFLSLPTLVALGFGTAGFSTMQSSIVMLVAREDMRGKALGVTSLAIGVGPIGALLVGGIASALTASLAIGFMAGAGILCLGLIAALMPSLRQRVEPDERLS